jgi:hypothetical protein
MALVHVPVKSLAGVSAASKGGVKVENNNIASNTGVIILKTLEVFLDLKDKRVILSFCM